MRVLEYPLAHFNMRKFFLLVSFLFIGGIIARPSMFFPYEISLAIFLCMFLFHLYQGDLQWELPATLKLWVYAVALFFVFNTIPLIYHLITSGHYANRLSTAFEKNFLLIIIVMWVYLAVTYKVTVLQVWKILIASVFWVAWVVFYEVYSLNGFQHVLSFIQSHRFGDVGSTYIIDFGVYSNTLFLFLLGGFLWFRRLSVPWRIYFLSALIVSFIGAILSQSRTAWIGWTEAMVIWGIFYAYWLLKRNKKKILSIITLFIVLTIALFAQLGLFSIVEKRAVLAYSDIKKYMHGNPETSLGNRLVMYEAAINSIKEHPFWGVGPSAFKDEELKQTEKVLKNRFHTDDHGFSYGQIHNQFLMFAMEGGILRAGSLVGLFVFLFYIISMEVKSSPEQRKSLYISAGVIIFAFFMACMPESFLYTRVKFLYFFITVSIALVMLSAPIEAED